MPADAASLGEVLATLEAAGYTGQMAARPGGRILCFNCHEQTAASDMGVEALGRTEGASDPDDMLAVVGLTCPHCTVKGTVVLGYGPEANADDAEVLVRLGVGAR
ncbi:MAG: hypothetical protein M3203_02655 [Actinomycetota bacterium]|nr:hypothetical protein [Actinomycetota bacterium]